jgi:hypothetical protein
VIVAVSEKGEETREITSGVEKQPGRFAGVRSTTPYESQLVSADDSRQRKFTGHLNDYYDEVIASIRDAESILIFGPGEAKGELKKRLQTVLQRFSSSVDTTTKMLIGIRAGRRGRGRGLRRLRTGSSTCAVGRRQQPVLLSGTSGRGVASGDHGAAASFVVSERTCC